MAYQENRITSVDLLTNDTKPLNEEELRNHFNEFTYTFTIDNKYIYRNNKQIKLSHMACANEKLYNVFLNKPREFVDIVGDYQFITDKIFDSIRSLDASRTNKIIRLKGIVTSISNINSKPLFLHLTCRQCLTEKKVLDVIPRSCQSSCGLEPFVIMPEKCKVVDTQSLKIQEDFDDVPENEIPRHCTAIITKSLCSGEIVPGSFISFTGILLIKSTKYGSLPFIRIIGIEKDESKQKSFSEDEIEKFKSFDFLSNIEKIIAPNISGHSEVKKAIACLLFGGTRRIKNGVALRGDVNVLLLGDPGIAKSQMLKFASKISPIAVYTSGKGSTAAGLTAAVNRNNSGEYSLEGGALVLGDCGICCIDEFDKMDEFDRVAIHEAMEQQTVSIAKAGITTVLNTRTAILAAANPKFGRYDDFKSPAENIEFGSTILSRFDCIFVLKDEKHREKDIALAKHILDININLTVNEESYNSDFIKRYITFAKSIHPQLSAASRDRVKSFYIKTRKNLQDTSKKNAIPITVRQLEAIIRMSEAFARMSLCSQVSEKHVDLAIQLFMASTMTAVNDGYYLDGMLRTDIMSRVKQSAEKILKNLTLGTAKTVSSLLEYAENKEILAQAITYLNKKNKLALRDRGRVVVRVL